jgi:hypothetical protein
MTAAAADLVVRQTSYDSCIILLTYYREHSHGVAWRERVLTAGQAMDLLRSELTITTLMKTTAAQEICNEVLIRNSHPSSTPEE